MQRHAKTKRFTLKTLFAMTLFAAILMGWWTTFTEWRRTRQQLTIMHHRVYVLDDRIDSIYDDKVPSESTMRRRFLTGQNYDGCTMEGVTINASQPLFQSVSFVGAELANMKVSAGGSSFQSACFDNANLRGAVLSTGGASFENATFVGADLTGATITFIDGSFQLASLRGANLTDATFNCPLTEATSFQGVDVDSAKFLGTDLSKIYAKNLERAYFASPPTYNAKTKFPEEFDPKRAGWVMVEE